MIPLTEAVILPFVGSILVLLMTWLFSPALSTLVEGDLEWEEARSKYDQTEKEIPLLSIVIPAYDEELRLPAMITDASNFLQSPKGRAALLKLQQHSASKSGAVEWLLIDDGSKDDTIKTAVNCFQKFNTTEKWRILSLQVNSGKGAAVKLGMTQANGQWRLMVDADGATDFGPGLSRLIERLVCVRDKDCNKENERIALFGSRAHLQKVVATQRSFMRSLLMYGFHFFVSLLVSSQIKDTQCGFKLFSSLSAKLAFGTLHLRRWAFDTELVLIAEEARVMIHEVDVPWHEIDGSKLNTSKLALAVASVCMLRDMICVRACYFFGVWSVLDKEIGQTKK